MLGTAREDRDTVVSDHAWLAQIARPTTFAPPCKGMLLFAHGSHAVAPSACITVIIRDYRTNRVPTGFQRNPEKITPLPAWAPLLRDTRHAPFRCRIYVERGIVRYGITYRIRTAYETTWDRVASVKLQIKTTPKPETRCRYSQVKST